MQNSDFNENEVNATYFIKDITFLNKMKNILFKFLGINSYLTSNQVLYCCQKLFKLEEYLITSVELNKVEVEKSRIEVSKLNYNIIQYKLFLKDRNKAMLVEHYLQNENLRVSKIEEFVKGFKL